MRRSRHAPGRASRCGLTLVEVLAVVTILAVLLGLLLPAVQRAREAARATVCRSHLRQIGFAVHGFQAAVRAFPPARIVPRPGDSPHHSCGGQEPTWFVHVMPFLEEPNAGGWDVYEPFASHPVALRTAAVSVYVCPSRRSVSQAAAGAHVVAASPAQSAAAPASGERPAANQGGSSPQAAHALQIAPPSQPFAPPPCCGGGVFVPPPPRPRPRTDAAPEAPAGPAGEPASPGSGDPQPGEQPTTGPSPHVAAVGAAGDYAGNHGDLSPGATGDAGSFYFGGNGTGVLISSRATCAAGRPTSWVDRIRIHDVTDGLSKTFLVGERHVPASRLGMLPEDGSMYDGSTFHAASRLAGPGTQLARHIDDLNAGLSFGSWHPDVCHFAMADGSVRSVDTQVSTTVLGALSNRRDGNSDLDR